MSRHRVYGFVIAAMLASCLPSHAGAQDASAPAQESAKQASSSASTPRTADGHPDLSGVWTGAMGGASQGGTTGNGIGITIASQNGASGTTSSAALNGSITANARIIQRLEEDNLMLRRMDPDKPIYKPQFWEKIQYNDLNQSSEDPSYGCLPAGVPRMGPPRKILQTSAEIVFFYQDPDTYRIIPMDGRPHTPDNELEGTMRGESLGHWEGDTLVVDSIGFDDTSWLDISGYFHSEHMHVIERLHRNGDMITWQTTVEDPEMLLRPWVMNPRMLKLNPDPKAILEESLPCIERDAAHLVTKDHH